MALRVHAAPSKLLVMDVRIGQAQRASHTIPSRHTKMITAVRLFQECRTRTPLHMANGPVHSKVRTYSVLKYPCFTRMGPLLQQS